MDRRLLYIDQHALLKDPRIKKILLDFDYPWACIDYCNSKFDPGTKSLYVRAGINNLPFRNDIVDQMDWKMPEFLSDYPQTFGDCTDQRCLALRQNKWDRPWVVFWSGGIDSTTIVASILKNIPRSDWENITIACNHGSIAEYPWFFQKFIKPNFKIVDSSVWIDHTDDNFFINGEPADQLFAGSISQKMMLDNVSSLDKNIYTDPDDLIGYLGKDDQIFGKWYYETMIQNLQTVNVPVSTYHDFFWWTFFNYSWVAIKMRTLLWGGWAKHTNAQEYFSYMITWFDTKEYQLWSMANNTNGAKYGNTVGHYKQAARDYIFRVTKDSYYHRFKTKTSSGSNLSVYFLDQRSWVAMLDDLTLLNLQDHRDLILELLPEHLGPATEIFLKR